MSRCIDIPCDILAASYRAGQNTITLARRHSCSPTTIAKRLRGCGVALRDARFPAIGVAEALLRQLYIEERLPLSVIAARLGISVSTIGNKRRAYGIPIRPRRACVESKHTNGRQPA
jgi:transcriptional regulator of aromatic amino acid metabolism